MKTQLRTGLLGTAALLLGLTSTSLAGVGQEVVINFDQDPWGNDIPNGTDIANLYASWGVTFHATGGGTNPCGTSVYASSECTGSGTTSPPNVVTLCGFPTCSDISENAHGLIVAELAGEAIEVCIEFLPIDENSQGIVRAYDAANNLLTTETSVLGGGIQNLCPHAAGIRRIEFSGNGGRFAWFDNLQIFFEAVPTVPTTFSAIKAMYK